MTFRRTLRIGLVITALFVASTAARAAGWDTVESLPGASPVRVYVKDRPRTYFRVSPGRPIEIPVDGPARLRVVSRCLLSAGNRGSTTYRVRLAIAGTVLKEFRTESSPAPAARLEGSGEVLCKSRTSIVNVPAGRQKLTLSIEGANGAVVRILTSSPRRAAGESYVSLAPVAATRSVTLSEGQKMIPYYSVLNGGPVTIRVVGPTTLEISSRLDFDSTMRGTQRYRLALRVDSRPSREAAFATSKSATATYVDLKNRVPSKLDRTVVPITEGGHEVTIELLEPKRGSVEIHARIPRPSVGNEE